MAKRLIEMVCTGNSGRSPVAELIARNHIKEIGADTDYEAVSSGTLVSAIEKGEFPIKIMSPFIEQARERENIYDFEQLIALDKALKDEDAIDVEGFYNQAIGIFVNEELEDRGLVLPELGINGDLKTTRDQTVAVNDRIAVLAMDSGNYTKVLRIYGQSEFVPTIGLLSTLATGDLDLEIPNAFGKGRDAYRETIEAIAKYVPRAVDKIVGA